MDGRQTKSYIYLLSIGAAVAFMMWFNYEGISLSWEAVAVSAALLCVCFLSRRMPIQFGNTTVEIVDISILLALVLAGPFWAVLVAIPAMVYRSPFRTLFQSSSYTLQIVISASVFSLFADPILFSAAYSLPTLIYASVFAAVSLYVVDSLVGSILLRIKYKMSVSELLSQVVLAPIPSDVIAIFSVVFTAYTFIAFGPAAALVLFVGAVGAITSLHLIHTRQRENEALKLENSELRASVVGFAAGMVGAVGEKDGFTSRLAAASSVYAGDVGREFGFDDDRVNTLRISSLLQDVGMISIPERVSEAPAERLNPLGRSHLERHTISGEEILAKAPGFEEAAKWVRWHHERMDGSGYPDHLKGQWLPLEARILAVCEVYASLVLDTPGSPALAAHDARMELTSQSGTGLDSEVVKALLRVLDREDSGYATATGERFEFVNPAQEMVRKSPGLRVVGDE